MQALCSKPPPARPPWGRQVDAGPAAHHHAAGDDPGRSHRDHTPPSRRRLTGRTGGGPVVILTRPCRGLSHPITNVGVLYYAGVIVSPAAPGTAGGATASPRPPHLSEDPRMASPPPGPPSATFQPLEFAPDPCGALH